MFKFVVIFFLMTNGEPAEEPLGMSVWRNTFPTEELCQQYYASDLGKWATSMWMHQPYVVSGQIGLKFGCFKAEDDSI